MGMCQDNVGIFKIDIPQKRAVYSCSFHFPIFPIARILLMEIANVLACQETKSLRRTSYPTNVLSKRLLNGGCVVALGLLMRRQPKVKIEKWELTCRRRFIDTPTKRELSKLIGQLLA